VKSPFACLAGTWEKAEFVEEATGWIRLVSPCHGVLYDRVEGQLGPSLYPRIIALGEKILGTSDQLTIFNDWEGMTEYVAAARNDLTSWVFQHRGRIAGIHFVTRSMKVTLGVVLAGSAFRVVRHHKSRTGFEAALEEAMGRRGRPRRTQPGTTSGVP